MRDLDVILPDGSKRPLMALPRDWWELIATSTREEIACLTDGEEIDAVMDRIAIERVIRGAS